MSPFESNIKMGQSQAKLLSQERQLSKVFVINGCVKEDNLSFLTSKATGLQYLLREIVYNDEREYNRMIRELEERRKIRCPFITQLERLEAVKEEGLCSRFYRIFTLWEYPRRTLAEEISERALVKLPFTDGELRTMLLQLSQAMAKYASHNQFHQSLTTKSIMLTPQSSVKVVDVYARPTRSNFDAVFNKRSLKNTYLSPQQCKMIESQEIGSFGFDAEKSDVFVAGMIMIQCALLERQNECYQNQLERINWIKLEQKLRSVENRYGRDTKSVIERMLVPNIGKRSDWKTVLASLNNSAASTRVNVVQINKVDVRNGQSYRFSGPVAPVAMTNQAIRFSYNQPLAYKKSLKQLIQDAPVFAPPQAKPPQLNYYPPLPQRHTTIQQKLPQIITLGNHNTSANKQTIVIHQKQQQLHQSSINLIENTPANFQHTALRQLIEADSPQTNINHFAIQARTSSTFAVDRYAQGKRYEGYKVNGKKEGFGRFYLDNKLCFQGNWKDDMMEGQGKLFYQSGTLAYDGTFQKDRFHGFGKLYNETPELLLSGFDYADFDDIGEFWSVYQGWFIDDLKEGKGILLFTNGELFQGAFHRDNVDGQGVFTNRDGQKIRGLWRENRLEAILSQVS